MEVYDFLEAPTLRRKLKWRVVHAHKKRIHQTEFRKADIISLGPEDMMKVEAKEIEDQADYIIWLED